MGRRFEKDVQGTQWLGAASCLLLSKQQQGAFSHQPPDVSAAVRAQ
jgi:hypothetical protein